MVPGARWSSQSLNGLPCTSFIVKYGTPPAEGWATCILRQI
jgi:hypothetical protein